VRCGWYHEQEGTVFPLCRALLGLFLKVAMYDLIVTAGPADARAVFRDAVEVIPDVALLRVAFSEFEERLGNLEAARSLLKATFQQLPSAFSFSSFQRFVRRQDGKVAARCCFSDTASLRQEQVLNYEVFPISEILYWKRLRN